MYFRPLISLSNVSYSFQGSVLGHRLLDLLSRILCVLTLLKPLGYMVKVTDEHSWWAHDVPYIQWISGKMCSLWFLWIFRSYVFWLLGKGSPAAFSPVDVFPVVSSCCLPLRCWLLAASSLGSGLICLSQGLQMVTEADGVLRGQAWATSHFLPSSCLSLMLPLIFKAVLIVLSWLWFYIRGGSPRTVSNGFIS